MRKIDKLDTECRRMCISEQRPQLVKRSYCKPKKFWLQFIFSNFGMAYEGPKLNFYLNFVKVVKPLEANSNVHEHGKLV